MQPEQQPDEEQEPTIGDKPKPPMEVRVAPTDEMSRYHAALAGVEDLARARYAAAKVVETCWEEAREDFYRSAGKGPATNHVFHALVTLKNFAEGK